MRVIVTDCHYRGTLPLIRELASCGHRVTAVCEGGRPPLGLHCRQAQERVLFPPNLSEREYAEILMDLCSEHSGSVLLPFGARTIAAISRRREAFGTVARFLVSAPDALETAGDKLKVARLAERLQIPIPQSFRFDSADPVEKLAGGLPYPIVLKYRNGEILGLPAERRYTIARDPQEFVKRYNVMHDVQKPVIVQEYIPGKGLGVSVLMDGEHRALRVFCHERLREFPTTGGPSTACRSDWFPALVASAVKLLTALRFTGFAMVEFKGAADDARLLEINPRIWGSYPLAIHSGTRMAEAYVNAVYGIQPPAAISCGYKTGVKMQYFFNDCR
ncbi:MAG: ATP-grasp domain-containing protein, partial [Oscillospiraceae bacterium]|nr:ATP-grasp domain-containing protein [Oscillospiraceae bacterium]